MKAKRHAARPLRMLLAFALMSSVAAAHAAMIEGRTTDGRRYVAGGIGLEESESMRQMAAQFSLAVVTAARNGAYLANTHVRVLGPANKVVLDTVMDAPWLLVDLPTGQYTVLTTHAGKTIERRVNIAAGKPHRVVVQYDVPADQHTIGMDTTPADATRSRPPQ